MNAQDNGIVVPLHRFHLGVEFGHFQVALDPFEMLNGGLSGNRGEF